MKEAQKNVREYLAAIGKRGGLAGRRELTRACEEDGRYSRDETRGAESRKTLALSRPQIFETKVRVPDPS
jgi:hypothetical protein